MLTGRELEARHEIALDNYTTMIRIESRVMGDLALNHIIPVAIRYQNILINNVKGLKAIFGESEYKKSAKNQLEMISNISNHIQTIIENAELMRVERKRINNLETAEERAKQYSDKVKPFFDVIRKSVDKLELMVDDEMWPLPKYRELLFTK